MILGGSLKLSSDLGLEFDRYRYTDILILILSYLTDTDTGYRYRRIGSYRVSVELYLGGPHMYFPI